jgi:hypothetical protein
VEPVISISSLFDPKRLGIRDENAIEELYIGSPCKSCGFRILDESKKDAHYDDHFHKNKAKSADTKSTQWYSKNWGTDTAGHISKATTTHVEVVPLHPTKFLQITEDDIHKCHICSDAIKVMWVDDDEYWAYTEYCTRLGATTVAHTECYNLNQNTKSKI